MTQLNTQQIGWVEKMMHEKFYFFCQSLMPSSWYDEKFHRVLCDFLQYEQKQKLIVLPRTHLKTTICSTFYPLWRASNRTSLRTLITSNTSPNAEKTVRGIRTVVETNKTYQAFFSECIPEFNKVRWSDRCACLNRNEDYPEGTFESAGVGANIIRRHFNLIVEDDTVAPKRDDMSGEECMPSREDVEQAIGFHRLTPPLLIDEGDEQLVIGTRWADYDHINYIMHNEKYAVFDKPANKQVDGSEGTLYKRFSESRLDTIKLSMGTYLFSSLYLNKPLSKEFMTFNPDWMRTYEDSEVPEEGRGVITHDPADPPTGKKSQDYSALVACWHSKKGVHVRGYVRARMTDAQAINAGIDLALKYGCTKIRVEADRYAHLQFAYREEMKRRGIYLNVEGVKTRGKQKEGRIRQRLQPLFENGVIYTKANMRELEEELFAFPNGVHDDLIDALAWQIEDIYPTEKDVPKSVQKRHLPTIGEMYDTLLNRGGRKYPFEVQLQGTIWQSN